MTALLSAAAGGHVECVRLLVDDKCDVNVASPVRTYYILSNIHARTHTCIYAKRARKCSQKKL